MSKFSTPSKLKTSTPRNTYSPLVSENQVNFTKRSPLLNKVLNGINLEKNLPNTPTSPTATRKLRNSTGNNVKVISRFRPFNATEVLAGSKSVVEIQSLTNSVKMNMKNSPSGFTFDKIFDSHTTQLDLYQYSITDTVRDMFEGFHGTVICYGQTGSGKTHTMMGDLKDDNSKGIIPRIGDQIFDMITHSLRDVEYIVDVSYLEIYNETLRDLLKESPGKDGDLKIIEDKINGIHVSNLSNVYISKKHELFSLMERGNQRKKTSATNMNEQSSRSHSIFQIKLKQTFDDGTTKQSKLHLVDLAGSEKVDKTGATGQTLEEAKRINSSLSCLGNVINALTDGKSSHIPYRDSKLTRILQESLGGNSRTTLIINCSPSTLNDQETLSTLRFGARAKNIKNHAQINQELSVPELKSKIDSLTRRNERNETIIEAMKKELMLYKTNRHDLLGDLSDGANSEITIVDEDNDSSRDMSLIMDQLSLKENDMERSKDQQLIALKLRIAELETTNESLLYDLNTGVQKSISFQLKNEDLMEQIADREFDHEYLLKLEKRLLNANSKYISMQNKNNELMIKLKELDKIMKIKDKKLKTLLKQQQDVPLQVKTPHFHEYHTYNPDLSPPPKTARGTKAGFNLRIITPLKGGEIVNK